MDPDPSAASDAKGIEGPHEGVAAPRGALHASGGQVDRRTVGGQVGHERVHVAAQLNGHTRTVTADCLGVTDPGSSDTLFIGRPESEV